MIEVYPKGSFSGNYVPHGDPEQAEVVIGHTFSVRKDGTSLVNELLARFIDERYAHLPVLAHESLAVAMQTKPEALLEGDLSNSTGEGLGTWGELEQAAAFMRREQLRTAILVGQAFHIARVDLQARQFPIETIVPEGLPRQFDPESLQWWTRSQPLWIAREALGAQVLRHQKKL